VSSSDPQDEAARHNAWPPGDDASEEALSETPSWQDDPTHTTEFTVPHTYTSSGYLAPQDGAYGYPPPPDAPGSHAAPPEVPNYEASPEAPHYEAPPGAPGSYAAPPDVSRFEAPPQIPLYEAPGAPQYEAPQVPQYEAQPGAPLYEAPPQVPAGAGLVPPRADALPPLPEAYPDGTEQQTVSSGDPATNVAQHYPGAAPQAGYTDPEATYVEPIHLPRAPQLPWPANQYGAPAGPAPGTQWPQPAPTGSAPRPEDLLVPDRPEVTDVPATWGWRGRINRLSAGAIKRKAKPAELEHRRAILDIQHGFSRPMTVVVIQPKGGAGKTPTTIGIAAALGAHRGGYVVGWDDNETRGTLAVRTVNRDSQRTTVWELLGALASFERPDARVGDLGYYVRSQGEAQFDALVSDDHPGNMAQIGEDEFHRIHAVLQRFYRVIVIDTGNNVRSPNWQAAVNAADVVVIPSTYQRDVGYSGSWVLDHLMQTGREELARHAVTVLTAADPTTDSKVRGELLSHFGTRTQDVVEIPFDEHIATGGPVHWAQLNESTRRAWTRAGAVVVGALVRRDST
jgi:MinD-like ATPase involved in chromosome partitioning or flagellar assembly